MYLACSGENFEVFQRFIEHIMSVQVDLRGKLYYSKGGSGGLSYISCKYQLCFRCFSLNPLRNVKFDTNEKVVGI